uniref:Ig-like domain-containing protein n=1 Tax=Neolamprologus brichardi TaxID=32507 RepID=A0A3Q4NBE1_NEOBR
EEVSGEKEAWVSLLRLLTPHVDAPKLVNVSVTPSGEIVEGNSVTLTCSSDANPAAKYTWYKGNNNKPLSVDTQLVFTSIQRSESGQYRCRAYNRVGATSDTISIHVKYPPNSVTLTCSSDAKPTANHFWYKDDDQTPLSNERQLSITSIQSFDSGEYVCAAENYLGRMTSEFIFIVVICKYGCMRGLYSCTDDDVLLPSLNWDHLQWLDKRLRMADDR